MEIPGRAGHGLLDGTGTDRDHSGGSDDQPATKSSSGTVHDPDRPSDTAAFAS